MSTDAITTTASRMNAGLQENSSANSDGGFQEVVRLYKLGHTPEDIADECENLTMADVFVALDYYFASGTERGDQEVTNGSSTKTLRLI